MRLRAPLHKVFNATWVMLKRRGCVRPRILNAISLAGKEFAEFEVLHGMRSSKRFLQVVQSRYYGET